MLPQRFLAVGGEAPRGSRGILAAQLQVAAAQLRESCFTARQPTLMPDRDAAAAATAAASMPAAQTANEYELRLPVVLDECVVLQERLCERGTPRGAGLQKTSSM
jgi:hypothetical protein